MRYPPPQRGYLSDTGAIPYENKANGCDTPLCDTISKGYCAIWGGYLYMREIGTMWQIGVLTGKPCTFLVQNGSFSAFWHYKNKERLSKGLDVKLHIPSTCLDASRKWFSTGIYSINRASEWPWHPRNPLKWPKCARFPG